MYRQEWHQEKVERHLRAAKIIPFGVSFLDDALCGILPNDLIVIGARTGRGKTELATTLAYEASKAGRDVALFALEADQWELQARLKYRKLRELYYANFDGQQKTFRFPMFREWLTQGMQTDWEALEQAAEDELQIETMGLHIHYRGSQYTSDQFVSEIEKLKSNETDLVIIDHLHYFDLGEGSEINGLKKCVHAIRNASIHHGIPIILLAHLRKGERMNSKTLPDLDDFHGHSDITKVATTVLLLSPVPQDKAKVDLGAYPTYFHIAKARSASYVTPFVGIHGFDMRSNTYSKHYYLAKASFSADPTDIEHNSELPTWAKRSRTTFSKLSPYEEELLVRPRVCDLPSQRDRAAGGDKDD